MGVNILELIIDLYLATVIATVIAFVLIFRRIGKYYKRIGKYYKIRLRAIFNEDILVHLFMCFIPVVNIKHGLLCWNASQFTDEELETYLQGEEDEY